VARRTPPTKNGKLSEAARHVVLPSGITSTGWPAVRDTCANFGVRFDAWQSGAGRAILAKRKDGKYACSIGGAVLSIPRQVGKTFLIGAIIFALCLLQPGLTVLWTAHRLRTANETFAKMQAFAGRKLIKPHVKQIFVGSGEGEIVFHNGSRILFGARERGFGRGFDDVDVEVFDEAQILTDNAIDDMVPATNTAPNPLLFFLGTPPKPNDPSEVFTRKRSDALSGESDDTVYIEFSADEECNPEDRKQWAKANPSYPTRTPDAAMLRMFKNLTIESFVREALGVWDAETGEGDGPVPMTVWDGLIDVESAPLPDGVRWALDVALDRSWASICLVGKRADGLTHVEITTAMPGTAWVAARAKEIQDKLNGLALTVGKSTPAESLLLQLAEAGVEVDVMTPGDQALAFTEFVDATKGEAPTIRHRGEPALRRAVKGARTKPWTDGGATLSRRASVGDVSPFSGVILARGRVGVEAEPVSEFVSLVIGG
jgi:hypothetical protein